MIMVAIIDNHCHQTIFGTLFSGPPSQIELRSSGGAGEWQGDKMGLYQLLPDAEKGDEQGPVYRQRHDGDNQHFYLYR